MQGAIVRDRKIHIAVPVGDTRVSTPTVIYVPVPIGQKLKDMIN
jgi:hypothetical protein